MGIREDRRAAVLEAMADHLLDAGLAGSSLRLLASAAGTSDRMLLYYFADKDELLAAVLARIAARLTGRLDAALPSANALAAADLIAAGWDVVGSPALRPYMRLWLDLAAAAARGQQPQRAIATALLDGFAAWIADRLADLREMPRVLATIEGALFLDAAGRRDLADAAIAAFKPVRPSATP